MRILVTGACGFIGSNFLYYLANLDEKIDVVNLDILSYAANPENLADLPSREAWSYSFVHGDIADSKKVEELFSNYSFDAVVNFAAESHVDRSIENPFPFLHSNILGTQNLLELAKRYKVPRFVQVSTDEVYGTLGPEGLFQETTPIAPNSPYSASKASADLLCRAYYETYKFPVLITRCSNNYGPYQFPEKLIPLMFTKALRNEPLPVYGDGKNVRDWIYVDDHCHGVWLALTKGKEGAVYNLGGAAEKTNIEVVEAILDYFGRSRDLIQFVNDRPGHDRRYAMDFSFAHKELGFVPRKTFSQGIRETLDWYSAHPTWLEDVMSGAYKEFMKKWYGDRV